MSEVIRRRSEPEKVKFARMFENLVYLSRVTPEEVIRDHFRVTPTNLRQLPEMVGRDLRVERGGLENLTPDLRAPIPVNIRPVIPDPGELRTGLRLMLARLRGGWLIMTGVRPMSVCVDRKLAFPVEIARTPLENIEIGAHLLEPRIPTDLGSHGPEISLN
jgi:hypothetical protein